MNSRFRPVLVAGLALAAFALAARAADPPPKPAITPVGPRQAKGVTRQDFNPTNLPDSLEQDLHAAWWLRQRLGKAYWPGWAAHTPAPVVVRAHPVDFFVLHPDPPGRTTSPREMAHGGYFYTAMERLLPTMDDPRIEMHNRWWCVAYDLEHERRSTHPDVVALLVTRDFMVYETTVTTPTWGGQPAIPHIMALRTDPDLVTWLDQEAAAIRSAVLTDDPKERNQWVDKAVRARHMAEERALKDPKVKKALDWFEAATKSEGAARYIEVLATPEARAVVAGDTAYALPLPGGEFSFRAKLWRERMAKGRERDVTGANLASLREVGALYCVLLDAAGGSWQTGFFDPTVRLVDQLDKARKSKGNSQAFGG